MFTTSVPVAATTTPTGRVTVGTVVPTTGSTAVLPTVAAANPLNSAVSLARRPCDLPPWDDPAFLDTALRCLDLAWRPVLERLGIEFRPARLVVTETPQTGTCTRPPEGNSFYCNGVISLAPSSYRNTNAGPRGIPAAAVSLLAHEYGHHVQELSGTLAASTQLIAASGRNSPAGLEVSRRAELQAQCFAGMFVGASFDLATAAIAQQDNYTRGDAPGSAGTHGTPAHFGDWFTVGVQRNSLDSCNTWAAPPDTVR